MTKLNKITLFIFSFFIINNNIVSTSFADEDDVRYYDVRYYDVEIIVFENTRPKYLQSELWKKSYVQIQPETFAQIGQPLPLELSENYNPLFTFKYIENTEYRLNDIVANLNKSNLHRVLLHSAWRQPGMSNSEALSVKVNHFIPSEITDTDETIINQNEINDSIIGAEQENGLDSNFSNTVETDQTNKEGFVLSGYIKLVLSRYLHLKIDLIYREIKNEITEQFIDDEFGDDDSLPDVFHITQTRRLRSKELHYIDHPVISIIALITPYKVNKQ